MNRLEKHNNTHYFICNNIFLGTKWTCFTFIQTCSFICLLCIICKQGELGHLSFRKIHWSLCWWK